MTLHALHVNDHVVLEHEHFEQLFTVLRSREYQVVGPTVRDHAIVYDTLTSVADLPADYTDPTYQSRRKDLFIVALNCGHAGGTCFCVSMHTGPKATFGFDLALTEVLDANRHYFVVQVGTEMGAEVLSAVSYKEANAE